MEMLAGSDLWRSLTQTPPRSGTQTPQGTSSQGFVRWEVESFQG